MELRGLLTECVHESSSTLLLATAGVGAGVDDRHAVVGRGGGRRGSLFVFWVTAAGAVVTARGRRAVGVWWAVAAAQLVHDSRLCHQLCARTFNKTKQSNTISKKHNKFIQVQMCWNPQQKWDTSLRPCYLSRCRPWGMLGMSSLWEESSWSWLRSCYCCCYCCCCCWCCSSSAGSGDWSVAPCENGSYCCPRPWKCTVQVKTCRMSLLKCCTSLKQISEVLVKYTWTEHVSINSLYRNMFDRIWHYYIN